MKRYWALKTRFLALLLGGFAVPVIALGFGFFYALMNGETKKRTEQHLISHARSTIRQVDGLLDRAAAATRTACCDGALVGALSDPAKVLTEEGRAPLIGHLNELAARHARFDLIVVVDKEKRVLGANTVMPEASLLNPSLVAGLFGKPIPGESVWVDAALAGKVDPVIPVVKVNRGISELADRLGAADARDNVNQRYEQLYVRYAAPVWNAERQILGAICFYLNWRHIQCGILDRSKDDLSDAFGKKSGYAFMFDTDNRTIIAHDNRALYETDLIKTHNLPSLHKAVRDRDKYHDYEYPVGKPKLAGLATSRSPAGFSWTVGTGVYDVYIYEGVKLLGTCYALTVIALAVVTSYFALRMTRRFRLSVDRLIQTAGRVARGETPGLVHVESKDEIGHLAEAFNEMAESLRKHFKSSDSIEKPFREIRPNPFIFGNPIKSREMFYGRRKEFTFAKEILARSIGGLVIVFCGERRSGKTSVLYQLRNGELGENFAPVFIDLQAFSAVTHEDEFFEGLSSEIADEVSGAGNVAFSRNGQSAPQAFKSFVDQLLKRLSPRRLVILFDEYETLETLIERGSITPSVVPFLASFTEAEPPVSFVFSGSRALEDRDSTFWAPLVAKSQSVRIGLLAREDALSLIEEPVADVVEYDFGIPGGIVRLTGGHPYYTQVICQNLVDHLNRVRRNSCDARDLASVVDDVIQNPPPQMVYFWKQRSIEERMILSLLAERLNDDGAAASAAEVARAAIEYKVEDLVTERLCERIIPCFKTDELLEEPEPGRYRFRIDLFRIRIKRAHSMWQILREEPKFA
jgi:HAMP domain-containing protein